MANLVELHYFNNDEIYFQLHNQCDQEPNTNKNIMKFHVEDLNNYLGDMDLYLLDLVLKDRIEPGRLLDAGFGSGRNLIHFLQREEFEVYGAETDSSSVTLIRHMMPGFSNQNPNNFQHASLTKLPFENHFFQTVICARVFHFLDHQEKQLAWEAIHDVLLPNGLLYLSTNSMVNFEERTTPGQVGQHVFPDETQGYFLTRVQLDEMINDARYEQIEPVRNIQYDDQHAETILVFRKK